MSSEPASLSPQPESTSSVVPFPRRSIYYPSRREVLASAACKGLIGLSILGLVCAFVLPETSSKQEPEPLTSAEFSDDLSDLGAAAAATTPPSRNGSEIIPVSAVDSDTDEKTDFENTESTAESSEPSDDTSSGSSTEPDAEIEIELGE